MSTWGMEAFDPLQARSRRVREHIAQVGPWLLVAGAAMLAMNWGVQATRSPAMARDWSLVLLGVVALLALALVFRGAAARGEADRAGAIAVGYAALLAGFATALATRADYGQPFAVTYCGLFALGAIFVWPRGWAFVAGTACLLGIPLAGVYLDVSDAESVTRVTLFAVNCLGFCLGAFFLTRRANDRAARQDQAIGFRAHHDGLTGLLNRETWEVAAAAELAQSSFTGASVMVLDVDRFKAVNDTHGHAAGDRVLADLGEVIHEVTEAWPGVAHAGRIGGDEFAILFMAVPGHDLRAVGASVQDRFRRRVVLGVEAGISVGIARAAAGESLASVTRRADASMYERKGSRPLTLLRPMIADPLADDGPLVPTSATAKAVPATGPFDSLAGV